MKPWLASVTFISLAVGCDARAGSESRDSNLLTPVAVIPMDGVDGRIDHFAFDEATGRLFVAALGNNTVEVVDVAGGRVVDQIKGLRAPQGVALASDANRLAIANDDDGTVRLVDAKTLRELASLDLGRDADNVRYDAKSRRFWVGYGDGGLAQIDPATAKITAKVKLDSHPESFQLETNGPRIFVNVPGGRHVAVIDREKQSVIAKWSLEQASSNFPMAIDELNRRLYIGCRSPAKMLSLDIDTGKTLAAVDIVGDTDDLFCDIPNGRIYVTGGDGRVSIVAHHGDTYTPAGEIKTAAGARTSFFMPDRGLLCVAVPHRSSQKAELRLFRAGK